MLKRCLARIFSLRHEFPNAWHRFLAGGEAGPDRTLAREGSGKERFPFIFRDRQIALDGWEIYIKVADAHRAALTPATLKIALSEGEDASNDVLTLRPWNGMLQATSPLGGALGEWTLTA